MISNKTLVLIVSTLLLSACGNKVSSTMDVYASCEEGNQVTLTVTQGTFGSSASVSCTFIKTSK